MTPLTVSPGVASLQLRTASCKVLRNGHEPESDRLNAITEKIIGDAIRVHKELGPGILESACEACLTFELVDLGLAVERQKTLPITYRGRQLDHGYRIDLLVEQSVLVEVKSIERLERVHSHRSCRTFVCSNLGLAS